MKMSDIKKIIPLKKEDIFLPLEGMSEKERKSLHYCNLADYEV